MDKKLNEYSKESAIEAFSCFLAKAEKDEHILRPISWALYQTWKRFDAMEKDRHITKGDPNKRCPCD